MKIEHIALWVEDLEKMRSFYMTYFGLSSNELYHNASKGFKSYFLSFTDSSARIELMTIDNIKTFKGGEYFGFAHFAISVGSKEAVDDYASRLEKDGFTISSRPRTTGDGYDECAVIDPEGNKIEITA